MPAALPDIMARLSAALTQIGSPEAERAPDVSVEKPTRAQIGKLIQGDGMVSFPDGKSHTSLKSHLASRGPDPRSYRDHSGLPADYRVVVPWHAGQRSALARPSARVERARRLGPDHAMVATQPDERAAVTA